MSRIIDELNASHQKAQIDSFTIGDNVDVHVRIVEGEKERVQVFKGTVIARRGRGINETFVVRHLIDGMGVERLFPVHSPRIEKVVVTRNGRVHRAKLYYLRDRVGKSTRLREDLRKSEEKTGN